MKTILVLLVLMLVLAWFALVWWAISNMFEQTTTIGVVKWGVIVLALAIGGSMGNSSRKS